MSKYGAGVERENAAPVGRVGFEYLLRHSLVVAAGVERAGEVHKEPAQIAMSIAPRLWRKNRMVSPMMMVATPTTIMPVPKVES